MDIQKEIEILHERNKRVEADKSWEVSWTRRSIVAVLTYFVIVILFFVSNLPKPWLNALVPTAAFILSTMTLPLFKRLWLKYFYKK